MNYQKRIETYLLRVKTAIESISSDDLSTLINVLEKARMEGQYVFIMGNGGSAATASHFCCDFNKGISEFQEKKNRFICLNDNIPTMMAYANDRHYDQIFVGPLSNFLRPGDIVIGISASGNSANVVNAIEYANAHGATTVGLTGFDGGKVKQLCKINVNIPIEDMQITEDLHMVLDHCMMQVLSSDETQMPS